MELINAMELGGKACERDGEIEFWNDRTRIRNIPHITIINSLATPRLEFETSIGTNKAIRRVFISIFGLIILLKYQELLNLFHSSILLIYLYKRIYLKCYGSICFTVGRIRLLLDQFRSHVIIFRSDHIYIGWLYSQQLLCCNKFYQQ